MAGRVTKNSAGHLALVYRKRAAALGKEQERALRDTLASAKAAAIGFSSARGYNPRTNKRRPYSRRNPGSHLPAFLVNVQSGRFRRSWRTRVGRRGQGWTGSLYNTAPYSGAFDGQPTRYMIARPILQEVRKVTGTKRRRRERDAVRRAMRIK